MSATPYNRGAWVVQIKGKGRGRVGRVWWASDYLTHIQFGRGGQVEPIKPEHLRFADPHEMPAFGYFPMMKAAA